MKTNLPVTGSEHIIAPGRTLVSRTDTKGMITFANDAFVEACGFSREELIGVNHNIIRHPDIPPAVFEDMWRTLQNGLPWHGVVKNRCKNGDHYWVDANVVPVRKNGETIGYMSVRTVPSREAIANAGAAYIAIAQAGKIPTPKINRWKNLISIKNGFLAGIAFFMLMMISGGIVGISGLYLSNTAIRSLYHDKMEPVQSIGRINFLMAESRAQIALALRHRPTASTNGKPAPGFDGHMAILAKNHAEIQTLWTSYSSRQRTDIEHELSEQYQKSGTRYIEEGLIPAKDALERGDYDAADKLLQYTIDPTYEEAKKTVEALLAFVSQKAKADTQSTANLNETISIIAMTGITIGSIISILGGLLFFRTMVIPLQAAVTDLERISEGNLSSNSTITGYGELGRVTAAVFTMQMHLKVMMDEIRISENAIHKQCRQLNNTMMNIAEHSDEQHDRVHQILGQINESAATLDSLEALILTVESTEDNQLMPIVQELAGAARIQAFTLQDTIAQMVQMATLIADSRGEVQGAWAASQKLELAALELDKLVKYFE